MLKWSVSVLTKKKNSLLKHLFSYVLLFAVLFLVANLLMTFIFSSEQIHEESMEPNFTEGDRVLSFRLSKINRGDVIIFKAPNKSNKYYIKRVIGIPGDDISYRKDQLYINGEHQKENYLKDFQSSQQHQSNFTKSFTLKKLLDVDAVPNDKYFVLGDNRSISEDSRTYGFISRSSIVGVVFIRFWPIGHFKIY